MEEKSVLRKKIKTKLQSMPIEEYKSKSSLIAHKLYCEDDWKRANTIGITVSRFPEVNTYPIIETAWQQGKKIVVPKCIPDCKQMIFREITSWDQLEKVYFGLLEPIEELTEAVKAEEIDLLIVPGLAFTSNGYRLGVGGGYYDRYLQNFRSSTLSLAFGEQVVESIPLEKHDLPVHQFITDKGE